VVSFAHGFAVPPSFYDSFSRHLASRGYLVIATDSQSLNFNPNRLQYVADMKDTITYMIGQNTQPGSFLEGRVQTSAIGASGHSLGGGIATVVAAEDPRVKALATFSAATLRSSGPFGGMAPPPYADSATASLNIPVSFINGSLDLLIPVSTNGQVLYDASEGPRLLPNILGGYHVGFTDFPFPPPFGDIGQPGSVSQEENQAFGRAELASFFDLYLKQDQSAWRRQWGPERLALAGVDSQIDPGFEISVAQSLFTGLPGQAVQIDITVRNTSDFTNSFELIPDENLWSITFSSDTIGPLGPGEATTIPAWVTIPTQPVLLEDSFLLTARSVADGGTRAFTSVTVAVPELSPGLLLGMVSLMGLYPILRAKARASAESNGCRSCR
jgi:dienelactone hydrolase